MDIFASVFTPFIYISALGTIALFMVSAFGKRQGYYEKGNFWFDDIMHFSGGFLVAVFWSGFTRYWPFILLLTLSVSVFWETQEYFRGVYKFKKYGIKNDLIETRDTIEDLICDVLGSAVWILILLNLINL